MTSPGENGSAASGPDHEVVIIGAGFSGIGAAIKLKQEGIDDFVILDQADDIGGTWRDNTYPGLAVDVASFTYQYSFEMNPDWSRVFAPGDEVKRYIDRLFEKYALRPRLHLGQRVEKLAFDEQRHLWEVHLPDRVLRARFVITAVGVLTQPKLPDIPGLEDFGGKTMHTARWDHDHELRGKRVAVIGTGATAVQLVPEIAKLTGELHVFQRTPIWVFPKFDPQIPAPVRWAFRRIPGVQAAVRAVSSVIFEIGMVVAAIYNRQMPFISRIVERQGRAFLRAQVHDPELREKLTPNYGFGCKRPTMSNDYLRTFSKGDAELVAEPIERVTAKGIRTADGTEREIDTLVLATGYLVSEPENAPAIPIFGREGIGLREFWAERRMQAYEGTTVPGFPNLFSIFGPYAFTGSSWMFMVEYQSHHIGRVIGEAARRRATLAEVRQEPHDAYFNLMLRRGRNTVFFNNRCGTANSYYFDQHGDAPYLRPSTALETWWRSRRFDLDDYRYESLNGAVPAGQTLRR